MSPSSQPLVSIVTPCHNTAPYLAACIESVQRQTYQHWEYVIQDNQSTDGSLEIAQGYAARDPRIRVVSTDTLLPQVANYNETLRQISPSSRYCKMVQADDWLFPECLERMVAVAEADPRIGLVSAYSLRGTGGLDCIGLPLSTGRISGAEPCRLYLLASRSVFGTPTSVLYRSDVVRARRPFYSESSHLEDLEVCFEILEEHDFGFVNQVLSFIRTENDSITNRIRSMNPYFAFQYVCLLKYGPRFLSGDEYAARLREVEGFYYLFLAEALLDRESPEFWEFHREILASVGVRIDGARVWKLIGHRATAALLKPLRAGARVWSLLLTLPRRVSSRREVSAAVAPSTAAADPRAHV